MATLHHAMGSEKLALYAALVVAALLLITTLLMMLIVLLGLLIRVPARPVTLLTWVLLLILVAISFSAACLMALFTQAAHAELRSRKSC
jgi:hypothetical protein